jgi:hypothetical protein
MCESHVSGTCYNFAALFTFCRHVHLLSVPQSSTVTKKGDAATAGSSTVITTMLAPSNEQENQISAGDVHA